VLCGLALLGILIWGICAALGPVLRDRNSGRLRALAWLGVILAAKLLLLPAFPGYWSDIRCWNLWAMGMTYAGPSGIYTYSSQFPCDYPPGYLYVLWLCGKLAATVGTTSYEALRLTTETPAIVLDFVLGLTIFAAIRRLGPSRLALPGALLFALNPGLLFDTLVWGQCDSALALPILLSMLLVLDSRYALGWAIAAIATLVKPQGLFLLPVLAWWTLLEARPANYARIAAAFAGTLIAGIAPFQIGRPWSFIFQLYFTAAERYRFTSVGGFNLMALVAGLRLPESTTVLGIRAFVLAMGLFLAIYPLVAFMLYRKRTPRMLLFAVFLVYLAMFVLAPRIHERYLYPAVALLIPLAFDSAATLGLFAALSATLLSNLYYVKQSLDLRQALPPYNWFASTVAAVNLAALALALAYGFAIASRGEEPGSGWPAPVRAIFRGRDFAKWTSRARGTALPDPSAPVATGDRR
jgi:Gpi18-like mannosyltransferase